MPDAAYQTFSYRFQNAGLIARYVSDAVPPGTYLNLDNVECRQENSLSSRYGRSPITASGAANTPLAETNIHTLGRMKGLDANTYRYAGAGTGIYRRAGDTPGAYTKINGANAMSGNRFSMAVFRPDLSSVPYIFFADSGQMLKDNGTLGTAQQWGIFQPAIPVSMQLQDTSINLVEDFEANAGFSYSNFTAPAVVARVNTTLSGAVSSTGVQTATPVAMTNIAAGVRLSIDTAGNQETVKVISVTATTFTALFSKTHLAAVAVTDNGISGNVAAGTTATVTKTAVVNMSLFGSTAALDTDYVNLWVKVTDHSAISEMKLAFDVGDGTFNVDYYQKSISPPTYQDVITGVNTARTVIGNRVFNRATGGLIFQRPGIISQDLLPTDDGYLPWIRPFELFPGQNVWTRVRVKMGDFLKIGRAGQAGFNWANVGAFRITIVTVSNKSVTVTLDDLYNEGGSGLETTGLIPYDYRITYENHNTGKESNPSPTIISANMLTPTRQGIKVSWSASSDTQVTHVKLYRRGGILSQGWYFVDRIAVGTTSYTDTIPDSIVINNPLLNIDNDVPVTSTLRTPVNTTLGGSVTAGSTQTVTPVSMTNIFPNQQLTIDVGSVQETVIVQSTNVTQFTAYFQYAHGSSAVVAASTRAGRPLNLCAYAFNRMWFAGDPDNPQYLYYSKPFDPESVPPQNFIEIGTPKDPIMAIVELRGLLYVFTNTRVYQVLAPGGITPVAIPTAVKHGLVSNWAWAIGEGFIYYQSYDGTYVFAAGKEQYISEPVQWIWQGKNLGPVQAVDTTTWANMFMCYSSRQLYVSYVDQSAVRHRLVFEDLYNRWRNDDSLDNAMLFEEDTGTLIGATTNGMIWKEATGDYDSGGYSGGVEVKTPIAFNVQTATMDHGAPKVDKVYNEFTLECDTQGQNVAVTALFDRGTASVSLGNVNSNGRTRVNLNIGSGLGRKSVDVALQLTGSVTKVVTLYETHIRALIEAEYRQSFDSYWLKLGTDSWKIMKQGWFEYIANDAGGISFSVYFDGSATAAFTFTLPQSATRKAMKVRFPAYAFKMVRFVATSASDFQFYQDSQIEWKPTAMAKAYVQSKLAA